MQGVNKYDKLLQLQLFIRSYWWLD